MGALADAALAAGGKVVGIIPKSLQRKEIAHHGLTEQYVVGSMTRAEQMSTNAVSAAFIEGDLP